MRRLTKIWQFLVCSVVSFLSLPAYAEWQLNMPRGVTPISRDIFDLHMTVFWICVAIGVVVFSVMIYSLIMHRKSRGAKAAEFHEHTSLEIFWAVVPFLILVIMAVPATKVLMDMENTDDSDVTVKITGYQWKWQYEYLDQGISFFSNLSTPLEQFTNKAKKDRWYLLEVDRPLVLPIHKKVRFLVTAHDVIHSWWVPDFGIKRDAIPGFIHEAWARIDKPGIYRGQCAELCGVNHGYMPIVVKAVPDEQFKQWVVQEQQREQKRKAEAESSKVWTMAELMQKGQQSYNKYCAVCHKVDGSGMLPTFPAMKGSSVAVGKPISRHIDMVLNGVEGSAMQAFANQMSDTEIAAVVTYERNAWGNNTGDVVQPAAVKQQRK